MPRLPAHFPPPPDSPGLQVEVNTIVQVLLLSHCLAEVALGIYHELTVKELGVWLGKTPFAVDALQRRLYRRLAVHTHAGVVRLVTEVLRGGG
jgi:hypothetical protein